MVLTSICDVHEDKELACLVLDCNPYRNECFLGCRNIQNKRETKNEQDMIPVCRDIIRLPILSTKTRNNKEITALGTFVLILPEPKVSQT